MKARRTFRVSVCWMVVLTFTMPFTTFAQQDPVRTEIPDASPAAPDMKAMSHEVKTAAERDASNAINKYIWFQGGMGLTCLGAGTFTCGAVVANSIGLNFSSCGAIATFTGCAAIGGAIPPVGLFMINKSKPKIPLERLMGKSPEYVRFYTDTYTRKTQSLQTKYATTGALTGCGLLTISFLILSQVEY